MPAAAALRDHDPDLHDALTRARPIAAQLRAARKRLEQMGPTPTLHAAAAQKALVGDLAADLVTIGGKAGVTGPALEFILEQDDRLFTRTRRRPALPALDAAVIDAQRAAERDLHEAHAAVTEAQARVEALTRRTVAAAAARRALGL